MKTFAIILSFVLIAITSMAQDFTRVPLEKYTMQVPDVKFLDVKGLNYRYDYVNAEYTQIAPDSILTDSVTNVQTAYYEGQIITKKEFQTVYYKLVKEDGRTAWDGNWNVPIGIYNNIAQYIRNTVTGSTVSTLRGFFAASGMPEIKPVMPED